MVNNLLTIAKESEAEDKRDSFAKNKGRGGKPIRLKRSMELNFWYFEILNNNKAKENA